MERMKNSRAAMKPIPSEFGTIREPTHSLALIVLGSSHWWLTTKNTMFGPLATHPLDNALVENPLPVGESPISQLSIYLTEYEQWNVAFKPIWRRAKSSQGKAMFKR